MDETGSDVGEPEVAGAGDGNPAVEYADHAEPDRILTEADLPEAKIAFSKRIKFEGRLAEVTRFRQTAITMFREVFGIALREQARIRAWRLAMQKFPQLTPEELMQRKMEQAGPVQEPEPDPQAEIDKIFADCEDGDFDIERDFEWAYKHIHKTQPGKAPSGGALRLRRILRKSPLKLLEWAQRYLEKVQKNRDTAAKMEDDKRTQLRLLDQFTQIGVD